MRVLESHAITLQRRSLPGLVALCESGKLGMADLTDAELERIVAGLPGDIGIDMRQLSDAELDALIDG